MSSGGRGWRGRGRGRSFSSGSSSSSSSSKPPAANVAGKVITVLLHSLSPSRFGLQHAYDTKLLAIYRSFPSNQCCWDADARYWSFDFGLYAAVKAKIESDTDYTVHELPALIRTNLMESRYLKQAIKASASPSFIAPAAAAAAASSSSGSTQRSAASPARSTTPMYTSAANSGADVLLSATDTADSDNDEYAAALSKLPAKLLKTLYNFQLDAVKFAIQRDGRVLIGDEMVSCCYSIIVIAYYWCYYILLLYNGIYRYL
jgi:hypothetical protein